jgi:hypothetical protein
MNLYICDMNEFLSPYQALQKRKSEATKRLQTIALQRTPPTKQSVTYTKIGAELEMTGQSVGNYVAGKGSDGFLIEALIKEFKKLPIVK